MSIAAPAAGGSISLGYAGIPAVVFGASGFIGAWTVRALRANGARVHAVVREGSRALGERPFGGAASVTEADLSKPGSGRDLLETLRPAVVFNLAGYGVDREERNLSTMTRLNTDLVAELCDCLASGDHPEWTGQRLVHVGSALEYGPMSQRLVETIEPEPATDYGRTKLRGTQHVTAYGDSRAFRGVVARLFTIYGDGEHPGRLLPAIRRAAATHSRLSLTTGAQQRDFTYVEDVADGLLRLGVARVAPGTVVHLATGTLTSVRSFAESAAAVLGMPLSDLGFGDLPTREEEMFHDEVDVTRLRTTLSWIPPTSVVDGIRRSCERAHVH